MIIVPNILMCGIGFSVSRPSFFAVESPRKYAIYPWPTSCKTTENTKTITKETLRSIYFTIIAHRCRDSHFSYLTSAAVATHKLLLPDTIDNNTILNRAFSSDITPCGMI